MLEEIKTRQQRRPFKPFVITLADGTELKVARPNDVWLPVPGRMRYFDSKRRGTIGVDPSTIVSLSPVKLVRSRSAKRKGH